MAKKPAKEAVEENNQTNSAKKPVQTFRLTGRVSDRNTGHGLAGLRVKAIDKDPHYDQKLGSATTDADGRYKISFTSRQIGKGETGGPDIVVRVFDQKGTLLGESEKVSNAPASLTINLSVTSGEVPHDLPIVDLMAKRKRPLSEATIKLLNKKGVKTFGDLRREGGLTIDANSGTGANLREISLLNSAATLSSLDLSGDFALTLAESGIRDIRALSSIPNETLVKLANSEVSAIEITRTQLKAVIAEAEITNMLVTYRSGDFAFKGAQASNIPDIIDFKCQCGCASAMSAQAYLTNLLRFAVRTVRYNEAFIDLRFLQTTLLQPFSDLPATCESGEKEVAQARIAIEVLRKLRNYRVSSKWYLESVYLGLLEYLGLNYDELRQAHMWTDPEKAKFIQLKHLGLNVPSDAQLVDELYCDIEALPSNPLAISEDYLQFTYGFRSTLLEPTEPDEDNPHALRIRQNALLAGWSQADKSPNSPLADIPAVDPHLIDELDFTNRVASSVRPNDVKQWSPIDFLKRRQEEWTALEGEMANYFTPSPGTSPAVQLKNMFSVWSHPTFVMFLPNSTIPLPPLGFRGETDGLDFPRLKGIYDLLKAGGDASSDLTKFSIEASTVKIIVEYVTLVELGRQVTADETNNFKRIIKSHIKRVGFRPHWIGQEKIKDLCLNPQQFRRRVKSDDAPDPEWIPTPGLGEVQERWRWEDVLRSRYSQFEELDTDLKRIVLKLEERLLPILRNELIPPPGSVYTKQLAEKLTDRFQLDFEAGECQRTTRVTQAITTIQGLLIGIRDGLLEDQSWSFVEPDFDKIWSWLGTYENWRAAISGYLFPERLLRPSLRRDISPGFAKALDILRESDPITPQDVVRAHDVFAEYLNDVRNLELLASASRVLSTGSGGVKSRAEYLFARPISKKTIYWSVALEQLDEKGDQSWWRPIQTMKDVDSVFGCAVYGKYLIALTGSSDAGGKRLELWRHVLADISLSPAKYLALDPSWEGPFQLELPKDVNTYDAIALRPSAGGRAPTIIIEADEKTTYSRPIAEDGTAWSGRFNKRLNIGLWQQLGDAGAGIPVANRATFACYGNGLIPGNEVDKPDFVLSADVDDDGTDEIIAFKKEIANVDDGFWAMKLYKVGSRLRWLPLGNRGSQLLDCVIPSMKVINHNTSDTRFVVAGDFDGDGTKEVAVIADAQHGGTYTSYFDLFVRKWHHNQAKWLPLGQTVGSSGSALWFSHPWMITHQCLVGKFTQRDRDEILVTFRDTYRESLITQFSIFGLIGNKWNHIVTTDISSSIEAGFSCDRGCVGHFSGEEKHELLLRKVDSSKNKTSLFWTLSWTNGAWTRLSDLDVGTISYSNEFGFPIMLTGDFDNDGKDEFALADGGLLVRFFRFDGRAWSDSPVGAVALPEKPAVHLVAGDFEGNGSLQVVVDTGDNVGHVIRWDLDSESPELMPQTVDLNLSSHSKVRGLVVGRFSDRAQPSALAGLGVGCTFYVTSKHSRILVASPKSDIKRIKPSINSVYTLLEAPSATAGAIRLLPAATVAAASSVAFSANASNRPRNQAYLEEGFYFLVVEVALRLQSAGNYASALQWLQLITKLTGTGISPTSEFLKWDIQGKLSPNNPIDLLDPIDPHSLARRRAGTYFRFTIETMIRLLCEYGDAQFSLANAESLPRARELYISALALLQSHPFALRIDACATLTVIIISLLRNDPVLFTLIPDVRADLDEKNNFSKASQLSIEIQKILTSSKNASDAITPIRNLLKRNISGPDSLKTIAHKVQLEEESAQTVALKMFTNRDQSNYILDPDILTDIRDIIRGWRMTPIPQYTYCVPQSSSLVELKRRIELSLFRLRNCMDIAGNELVVAPLGTEMTVSIANRMQASMAMQPLPYRYATLLDRAKQLVEIARQMENSMLGFIETSERKRYELLNARRDLALARSSQQLRTVQVQQAVEEVGLATLQRDKSQDQINRFRSLIRAGLSEWESKGLASQWASFGLKQLASVSTFIHGASFEGWVDFIKSWGGKNTSAVAASQAAAFDTLAQSQFTHAQFERRAQEWQFHLEDATRDREIGQQQMRISTIRLRGARIEREISALQIQYSADAVTLLTQKSFANEALYEWMALILQGVYRFFLKQATQMARLAELQLAFERQEAPSGCVKPDYWSPQRSDTTPDVATRLNSVDSVKGLTGAARLLRDIYQLDQGAFTKNKRKQQMAEIISLVRHDPLAFEQLRSTGRLVFDTPMTLFDSRSPGHYLRLVHRVRLGIIALVPPNQGIRATLLNSGLSEVVVPLDGGFKAVKLQRGFEQITFSSPSASTGQFELDVQSEMLTPFEGSGVATRWILDFPLPANRFDYSSLSDIIMTIEYTALYDSYLQEKTIKNLPSETGGERVFSLRNEFPDAWYDLHNSDQDQDPLEVEFTMTQADFPSNLKRIGMRHITLQVLTKTGSTSGAIEVAYFGFAIEGSVNFLGGSATTDSAGIAGTRRASGASWLPIVNSHALDGNVAGKWKIRFTGTSRQLFVNDKIEDILLAVSFVGKLPVWP